MFPTLFKAYEKRCRCFRSIFFYSEICYRYDNNKNNKNDNNNNDSNNSNNNSNDTTTTTTNIFLNLIIINDNLLTNS